MSAATLRRAAALMRKRAEAATPGATPYLSAVRDDLHYATRDDLHHIASWHPAVALAVADWLDDLSADPFSTLIPEHRHAIAVTRAYLGESA